MANAEYLSRIGSSHTMKVVIEQTTRPREHAYITVLYTAYSDMDFSMQKRTVSPYFKFLSTGCRFDFLQQRKSSILKK